MYQGRHAGGRSKWWRSEYGLCREVAGDEKLHESNEKEGKVVDVSGGEPKAVVVTADEVYLCPVSVGTLRKRIGGTFDSGGDE